MMARYSEALADPNLSFQKVEEIYRWYKGTIEPINNQEYDPAIAKEIDRVGQYKKIVENLTCSGTQPDKKRAYNNVRTLLSNINGYNLIHEVHRNSLQALSEPVGENYAGHAGSNPANELYWASEVCNTLNSFAEIELSKPNVNSREYKQACGAIYEAMHGKAPAPKPVTPTKPTKPTNPTKPTKPGTGFDQKR